MPESMVVSEKLDAIQRDKQKEKYSAQGTSVDAHAQDHTHAHVQYRYVKQAVQQREDEYLKGALHTGRIDRDQQIHLMRELEKARKGKQQNAPDNQPHVDPNSHPDHYEVIPEPADSSNPPPYRHQQPSSSRPSSGAPNEQSTQPSTGTSSTRARVRAFESPDRTRKDLLKMRDQHSVQDEHLLGHHSGRGGASNVPLRQQRSMPAPSGSDDHQHLQQFSNSAHQPQVQHSSNQKLVTGQLQVGTQTQTTPTLVEGSRVQIACNSPSEPFKYGVIRWIGDVPAIQGLVAGIELVS
jgi:hypothetical protein